MYVACYNDHLGVQLLLLRRPPHLPHPRAGDTAEHLAMGHHNIAAWLGTSRNWTWLHHLDFLTAAHAHAAARRRPNATGGLTPLDRAKEPVRRPRPAGTAAHIVLEWGAPWSRTTHKFYPPGCARVAALMRIAQAIKRGNAAYEADGVSSASQARRRSLTSSRAA